MLRRAYYTCPLQAAYMAKEFGVKSRIHKYGDKFWDAGGEERFEYSDDPELIVDLWIEDYPEERGIHPDSMAVFEPMVGDLVTGTARYMDNKSDFCSGVYNTAADVGWQIEEFNGRVFGRDVSNLRIIQRQGKPFFWPQWEEELQNDQ